MHSTDRSTKLFEQSPTQQASQVESALFSTPSHGTACALFVPLHYEPGYTYPLIVWLHAEGNDERQLMRVMPLVSMRNYVAVAPRGVTMDKMERSRKKYYGWQQTDAAIRKAEQQIFDSIDVAVEKANVCRRRVFIAGFGSGGTMAFRVAMNHARRFAGVLSLCGPFPSGHTPLGNLAEARRLSVFLASGRHSRQYPTTVVCENLRLLHTAGLSITLRQYPYGQELSPQMLADVDRWIIEQITSPEPTDGSPNHLRSSEAD